MPNQGTFANLLAEWLSQQTPKRHAGDLQIRRLWCTRKGCGCLRVRCLEVTTRFGSSPTKWLLKNPSIRYGLLPSWFPILAPKVVVQIMVANWGTIDMQKLYNVKVEFNVEMRMVYDSRTKSILIVTHVVRKGAHPQLLNLAIYHWNSRVWIKESDPINWALQNDHIWDVESRKWLNINSNQNKLFWSWLQYENYFVYNMLW